MEIRHRRSFDKPWKIEEQGRWPHPRGRVSRSLRSRIVSSLILPVAIQPGLRRAVAATWTPFHGVIWRRRRSFANSSTRGRNRIVLVELFALLMGQKKPIFPGELRRVLQLAFRNVGSVTADSRVIAQPLPRNRVDFRAHAQEATERSDRIHDMAANFLDHETPDRPNPLAGDVVNGRAMYLIALNERMCRAWRLQSIGHACFRRGS